MFLYLFIYMVCLSFFMILIYELEKNVFGFIIVLMILTYELEKMCLGFMIF